MRRCGVGSRIACGAALLLLVSLGGCSKKPDASLKGSITLDGEPLPSGSIDFVPADGKTPSASALIENGTYSANLYAGPKKVEIYSIKVIGKKPTYEGMKDSPMSDVTKQIVPEKYNGKTTLTVDVAPGENDHDFVLTTK